MSTSSLYQAIDLLSQLHNSCASNDCVTYRLHKDHCATGFKVSFLIAYWYRPTTNSDGSPPQTSRESKASPGRLVWCMRHAIVAIPQPLKRGKTHSSQWADTTNVGSIAPGSTANLIRERYPAYVEKLAAEPSRGSSHHPSRRWWHHASTWRRYMDVGASNCTQNRCTCLLADDLETIPTTRAMGSPGWQL